MRDVIVAGAGPAGTAAAIAIAQRGFDVLVCDRARFPRDTLCGEFLSPESHATLAGLGVSARFDALGPTVIGRVCLVAPDGRRVERALRPAGRGITRHGLDATLLARAREVGCHAWVGCRVTGCVPGPPFAVSMLIDGQKHTEHARAVIDATGHARWLARAGERQVPRAPGQRDQPSAPADGLVGIKRHYRPRWPLPAESAGGTLVLAPFAGGYVGCAPVEGGVVNVCLLARASDLRAAGGQPEALLATLARNYPGVAEMLEPLSPVGGFTTTAAIVLGPARRASAIPVGDAAGMIAPLAGDGVAMALRSGALVAEPITRFLQGACTWDESQARARRAWRKEFAGRMRVAAGLQRLATREGTANQMISLFERWPRAIDLLVRGTRGRVVGRERRPTAV